MSIYFDKKMYHRQAFLMQATQNIDASLGYTLMRKMRPAPHGGYAVFAYLPVSPTCTRKNKKGLTLDRHLIMNYN